MLRSANRTSPSRSRLEEPSSAGARFSNSEVKGVVGSGSGESGPGGAVSLHPRTTRPDFEGGNAALLLQLPPQPEIASSGNLSGLLTSPVSGS